MSEKKKQRLIQSAAFQLVNSNPRRFGVMFSPSSSRSRLRIVDSGRRYEIRLSDGGLVEYSLDGKLWKLITPFPSINEKQPAVRFVSFNDERAGELLNDIRFDMIGVGRGRVVAKEAGTTRVFHLVMDEIFRTHHVSDGNITLSADDPARTEDPAVPGAYWKLDPEFFITSRHPEPDRQPFAPPALLKNYSRHPASLRFKIFSEALLTNSLDATIVTQKAREWHLVDDRSPLMVTGPEDLKINEEDFKNQFSKETIKRILLEIYAPYRLRLAPSFSDSVYTLSRQVWDQIGASIITSMENWVKGFAGDPGVAAFRALMGLLQGVTEAIENWFSIEVFERMANLVPDAIADFFIDKLAEVASDAIKKDGFGALLLPANLLVALGIMSMRDQQALKTVDGTQFINLQKAVETLKKTSTDNKTLNEVLKTLMQLARQAADPSNPLLSKSPNPPPPRIPSFINLTYENINGQDLQERRAIQFTRVMDIGVGYSHWSEHWQLQFGGEIHSLLATRPAFQQEHYNLMQYRFLNGPVIDGDAFNDGTCNFYMLVKLKEDYPHLKERYTIVWIDEQTYFTQRWRLLDPTDDVWGDLFSISRTLMENPTWFQFNRKKFWSPFERHLNDDSRMVVRRQIVAVTGFDTEMNRHEIYTICYNYGVSDFTWRWRTYPRNTKPVLLDKNQLSEIEPTLSYPFPINKNDPPPNCVFVNSLELRDDATLTIRGFLILAKGALLNPVQGRWFQQYLPADFRHYPHPLHLKEDRKPSSGFDHSWQFLPEETFRLADQFYQLGIYEPLTNSRCQFYELELLPLGAENAPPIEQIANKIWKNDSGSLNDRLSFNTTNFTWSLNKTPDGYFPLKDLIKDSSSDTTLSMYEPTTRFQLLERKPFGLIAIFYDKRDDELQPASHLPREILLHYEDVESTIPLDFENEPIDNSLPAKFPTPKPSTIQTIRVLVKGNKRINYPPIVFRTELGPHKGKPGFEISFWTPLSEDEVNQNIWKIKLAALDEGQVIPILEIERFGNFVRTSPLDKPMPFILPRPLPDNLGDMYRYEYLWTNYDKDSKARIKKYCNEEGRMLYGTSLWFENIVGHRSTPEELIFK